MNLSLLVHTFEQYSRLWTGFYTAFTRHWPEGEVVTYWGTDHPGEKRVGVPFKTIYSGSGEWSDRLVKLLEQIPTEYVLYMQEDHYLSKSPPDLVKLMEFVAENDILRLQISPSNHFYTFIEDEKGLFFDEKSKYLVSHQPSIWKKSFLLQCLEPEETPWENEYEGTKRLQNIPELRQLIGKKIAIHPYNWFVHMCNKGRVIHPSQLT